jgi:hypothetical protein
MNTEFAEAADQNIIPGGQGAFNNFENAFNGMIGFVFR